MNQWEKRINTKTGGLRRVMKKNVWKKTLLVAKVARRKRAKMRVQKSILTWDDLILTKLIKLSRSLVDDGSSKMDQVWKFMKAVGRRIVTRQKVSSDIIQLKLASTRLTPHLNGVIRHVNDFRLDLELAFLTALKTFTALEQVG